MKKYLIFLSILGMLCFFLFSNPVFAYESQVFPYTIDLNNDGLAEIIDFTKGNLIITTYTGIEIFKYDFGSENTYNIKFNDLNKDGCSEILVEVRSEGTAQNLSYSLYQFKNDQLIRIFFKEDIYKGSLDFKDDQLIEISPVYTPGDCNANPSSLAQTYYKLSDNTLIQTDYQIIPNKILYLQDVTGIQYRNPSYETIEKILEQVAYEKGIPSVILKAIAWQESKGYDYDNGIVNWRQFVNGKPLIGFDGIGIGIMQVSDWRYALPEPYCYDLDYQRELVCQLKLIENPEDLCALYGPEIPEYILKIYRLMYDLEFNIREGAKILLEKWGYSVSTTSKIPKIGNMEPYILENWYFAIWAYNSFSLCNHPLDNPEAYQIKVIDHVNQQFHTPMYLLDSSFFIPGQLPENDIPPLEEIHYGDIKVKNSQLLYKVDTDVLRIRDDQMQTIGYLYRNELLSISNQNPIIYNGYVRYKIVLRDKVGWVAGNWLKPVGDNNLDNFIDLYDLVELARYINQTINEVLLDPHDFKLATIDVNDDKIINLIDLMLIAQSYNQSLYTDGILNPENLQCTSTCSAKF